MTSTTQLAASPKTFLERDNWMRAILASDLPDAAVRVALRIALFLRVNTGQCDPSYPLLAADSHVSERSVYRLVALLEHKGWIGLQRTRGRGRSNQYALLKPANPDTAMAGFEAEQTCQSSDRFSPVKPAKSTHKTCQSSGRVSAIKPATAMAGEQRKREREQRKKETLAPDGAPRRTKKKSPARKKSPGPELAAAFDTFWAAYPRRVAKEAARTAFAKAIANGATPEALSAGAKRYAIERNGEEPRYTKHPATWLNAGCWQDEAPGAAVIDESGNVVAFERPPAQRQRSRSVMEVAAEMVADIEARGDSWETWAR